MREITVVIDEDGDLTGLATPGSEGLFDEPVTRRASHVEPDSIFYRVAFHFLRLFGDKNKMAEWTRGWKVLWRVNTSPVGGPVLDKRWYNRQEAIEAEIEFLNGFFLEGASNNATEI